MLTVISLGNTASRSHGAGGDGGVHLLGCLQRQQQKTWIGFNIKNLKKNLPSLEGLKCYVRQ